LELQDETSGCLDPCLLRWVVWLVIVRKSHRLAIAAQHCAAVADISTPQCMLSFVDGNDQSSRSGAVGAAAGERCPFALHVVEGLSKPFSRQARRAHPKKCVYEVIGAKLSAAGASVAVEDANDATTVQPRNGFLNDVPILLNGFIALHGVRTYS